MEVIIKVEGMSCEHCVKAVKDAATTVDGVDSAIVDLEAKTATVVYDAGVDTLANIKAAIEDQGFDVID